MVHSQLPHHTSYTLRDRSGKIAIWPYIMRELPLSPVDALRLELRSRDTQGHSTNTDSKTGSSYRRGVQYFPARLAKDDEKAKTIESKQGQGQSTGHENDALKTKLIVGAQSQQGVVGTSESKLSLRKGRGHNVAIMRQIQEHNNFIASPDRQAIVKSTVGRMPRGDRRPASSGGPRRPPGCPRAWAVSSLWHGATGDHTECPLGCGEEVRVHDLAQHTQSLCALRYALCVNTVEVQLPLQAYSARRVMIQVAPLWVPRRCVGDLERRLSLESIRQVCRLPDAWMPGGGSSQQARNTFGARLPRTKKAARVGREGQGVAC